MGFYLLLKIWKFRTFRDLFLAGFITSTARWVEVLAFSVIAWQYTGNASVVALLMTARFIFVALAGLYFSINGSLYTGRLVMLSVTISCSTICFLVSLFYNLELQINLIGLGIISSISGALWSVDFSFRRRMLADSLPIKLIATGVSIDVLSTHATRLIGPLIGGVLLTIINPSLMLVFLGFLYLLSALFISFHEDKTKIVVKSKSYHQLFSEVINEISSKYQLLIVVLLTPIFNIFALPFLSLIGVLLIEKFKTNPFQTGVLTSFEGLGALIGGIIISAFPPHKKVLMFCIMLLLLLIYISFSSLASNIYIFLILIFLAGMTTASYSALQSNIIYKFSSPHLRSSTFSLMTIAIGSGAIGNLNIYWMTSLLNTQELTLIMGIEGLLVLILFLFYFIYKDYFNK